MDRMDHLDSESFLGLLVRLLSTGNARKCVTVPEEETSGTEDWMDLLCSGGGGKNGFLAGIDCSQLDETYL